MPSRNIGTDTSNYLIVPSGAFAFNLMHVGRDGKIPVAINDTDSDIVVSSAYFVFRVTDESVLLKEYLYIQMTSPEFDRYAAYCTDASVRDGLDWIRFCEIEINLPPRPIQQKFVAVYNAMLANQQAYESGLNDLKMTCDAYVERLRHEMPHEAIGQHIVLSDSRNSDLKYGATDVKGISIEKRFIETKADMRGVPLRLYKLVKPDSFAYVTVTSRNGEKISLAYNRSEDTYLCSSSYVVFEVKNTSILIPSYLHIFFSRPEFDRYSRFSSWGSARETFNWDDMCEVKIPIPDINVQRSIVNIYNAYIDRRDINERLKAQIKDLCPILIKGALQEGLSS
jgi:type I restriction enzyme S subunit